jgi:hypothetical protein
MNSVYFIWILLQNDDINIYLYFWCRERYLYFQAYLIICLICPKYVQNFVPFVPCVHKTTVLDKKCKKKDKKDSDTPHWPLILVEYWVKWDLRLCSRATVLLPDKHRLDGTITKATPPWVISQLAIRNTIELGVELRVVS